MTNSLSSFSLVGETGAPILIGADSPWNRSPKILFGTCCFSGRSDDTLGGVFSLGTNAASDFARECNKLPFLVNAAAAGCAFDQLDKNLAPRAFGGDAGCGGVSTTCCEDSPKEPSDPLYAVSLGDPDKCCCSRNDELDGLYVRGGYTLGEAE